MTYTKTVWKEDGTTPITAARLNNAETQYDEALNWVKGIGLGADAQDWTGKDLNDIATTGFFKASSTGTTNLPSSSFAHIIHINYRTNDCCQIVVDFLMNMYVRKKANGTWSAWSTIPVLTSAGILNLPNQSALIATSSGTKTFTDGVTAKVDILSVEQFDTQNEWATNKFTTKEAGVYFVRGFVDWGASPPTSSSAMYIYKNGSQYNTALATGLSNQRYLDGFCLVKMAAGDYLELYAVSNSGGTNKTMSAARIEIAKNS